jgi:glutamyl-tRNA reductase
LPHVLGDLRLRWPDAELALLSTCNRTELYCARPVHGHPRIEQLRHALAEMGDLPRHQADSALRCRTDARAAEHLFRVAAGLDSLVTGEQQIVAQVKAALAAAVEAGTAGRVMTELFTTALHTAKHIRNDALAAGPAPSAALLAVRAANRHAGLDGKRVAVIGTGEVAHQVVDALAGHAPAEVRIVGRTRSAAEQLARRAGATPADWQQLADQLAGADVVFTSTASPVPILDRPALAGALAAGPDRPMLLIDLAVPRDVERDVEELDAVTLLDLDDLASREALPGADDTTAIQQTISEHVGHLLHRLDVRQVAPTLRSLYRQMESLAAEELDQAARKLIDHPDAPEDLRILRRALHRTIRRICHPAARNLRAAAGTPAAEAYADALRKLFELDEPTDRP